MCDKMKMSNIALSMPEGTKKKMKAHSEMNWSNAFRTMVERKLRDFEEAERAAQKSKFTEKDVEEFTRKINKAIEKHAEELYNAHYGKR